MATETQIQKVIEDPILEAYRKNLAKSAYDFATKRLKEGYPEDVDYKVAGLGGLEEEALALADIAVVMNNGIIEQFDTPYNIFNKPKNEFVANFVGSHNVVYLKDKKIAVRMDQMNIVKTKQLNENTMTIEDIEFQGENVKLMCSNQNINLQILVDDKLFFKNEFKLDQKVDITWDEKKCHVLM